MWKVVEKGSSKQSENISDVETQLSNLEAIIIIMIITIIIMMIKIINFILCQCSL